MTDLPDRVGWQHAAAVAAHAQRATMTELLHAAAQLRAARDAIASLGDLVRADIARRFDERREADGGSEQRAKVGGVAQAYDQFHTRQVEILDHEECAAWLAEWDVDRYDEFVVDTQRVEVVDQQRAHAAIMDAWAVLESDDRDRQYALEKLVDCLEFRRTVNVDVEAVCGEFLVTDNGVVTADGEKLPGVSVTPRRFKTVAVRPDADYVGKLAATLTRQLTGGTDE